MWRICVDVTTWMISYFLIVLIAAQRGLCTEAANASLRGRTLQPAMPSPAPSRSPQRGRLFEGRWGPDQGVLILDGTTLDKPPEIEKIDSSSHSMKSVDKK